MSIEPDIMPGMLIEKERAFEVLASLWQTLADMNRHCNDFLIALEKVGPLTAEQEVVLRRWHRAISACQAGTLEKAQAAQIRPRGAALN